MRFFERLGLAKTLLAGRRRRQPSKGASERDIILASGLFDAAFYLAEAPDVAAANYDPLDHFLAHGWREGRRPCPMFDLGWYAHVHLRGREAVNPLIHYIETGEAAGCCPVAYFDVDWYRRAYGVASTPLRHYLEHRTSQRFAPNAAFDLSFYLAARGDEVGAGQDPFAHLIEHGGSRDLDPSAHFDSAGYRKSHMHGGSRIGTTARELRVPLVHDLDARLRAPAGIPPYTVSLDAVHLPESEIARLAATFAKGGAEAQALIDEMLAAEPIVLKGCGLPFRLAIALRARYAPALAEQLLTLFLEDPLLQHQAWDELMKTKAFDGRPGEAVHCFEAIERCGAATARQRKFASWCYARDGQSERALSLLSQLAEENPEARTECAASAQFYRFHETFGKARAEALLAEINRLFPRQPSISALEAEIGAALCDRRPYHLLRLGDGEGVYIHISDADERENADYYEANRREFHNFWFKDQSAHDDPAFRRAMRELNAAIANADCIGGIYREAIAHEYRIGSRRGIAWVVNTMRAVLQRGQANPGWAERTMIFHLTVHYDLLISGALGRLIAGSGRIGLIACYAELPGKIATRFGVDVFEFHKVPGEKIHSAILGAKAVAGSHWPDRFRELSAALDKPGDRRGQLFLIAAGVLGRVYGAKLKRAGAVVIDIGAVADMWMGKATRDFPALAPELSLDPP